MNKLVYMLGIISACTSLQAMDIVKKRINEDNCAICFEMLKKVLKIFETLDYEGCF